MDRCSSSALVGERGGEGRRGHDERELVVARFASFGVDRHCGGRVRARQVELSCGGGMGEERRRERGRVRSGVELWHGRRVQKRVEGTAQGGERRLRRKGRAHFWVGRRGGGRDARREG